MYSSLFVHHAELLKALAHPKRLEIINLLGEGPMSVTAMQVMLGLPQANLSQHLKILRDVVVVTQERKGKHIQYRLAHRNFARASDAVRQVLMDRFAHSVPEEPAQRGRERGIVVEDPVCNMRISPRTAAASLLYHSKRYYFCASGCRARFMKHPLQYA